MKIKANHMAGISYLFPIIAIAGVWYVFLSVGSDVIKPMDSFMLAINNHDFGYLYWWLLILPLASLILSIAHFSRLSNIYKGSTTLLILGLILTFIAFFTVSASLANTFLLPLLFTFVNYKEKQKDD